MKFVFNTVSFGVVPTYMALENFGWLWWLGYAILLVIVFFAYRTVNGLKLEANAAFNIVMAQATLLTIDSAEKRKVEAFAKQTYSVLEGDPDAVFENKMQELAYVALAMEDMEIEPVVLFDDWCNVRYPSNVPRAKAIAHAMEIAQMKMATKSA